MFRPAAIARLARLMCWLLLCLPLMQTAAVAHELGHFDGGVSAQAGVDMQDASPLARNGFCDACLAFSAIASGFAAAHSDRAAPAQPPQADWQPAPVARRYARGIRAYASRAPPFFLA